MDYCIELKNVHKYYGRKHVCDGIHLHIKKGCIYGLLGPNGAGKTTTIRLINGVAELSKGEIYYNGRLLKGKDEELNSRCGVLTENAGCYENLTVMENLLFFGRMYNMEDKQIMQRANYLLEKLGLIKEKNAKVKTFSTGMKKRMHLVRALLHDPEILFLDEPTSGLDPETAEYVTKFILELVQKHGKTILLCTHQLKYAEDICTDYAFISHGKIVAEGTYQELLEKYDNSITLKLKLSSYPEWLKGYEADGYYFVKVDEEEEIAQILKRLIAENIMVYCASPAHQSLTELYFKVIEGGKWHE